MADGLENTNTEQTAGAENEQAAELSLRDALAASFDEHEKPESAHDEGGKAAEPAAASETPHAAEKKQDAPATEPAKTESDIQPPATWNAADKAVFAKLPPDARAILARREKEITADYTRKTQDIAQLKKDYEPVAEAFKPYADAMKTRGFTPASMINAWINVEKALIEGRGIEIVAGIVKNYGIDAQKLIAALGGGNAPLPKPEGANGQQAGIPPALAEKLKKYDDRFKAEDDARAADAQARRTAAVSKIESDLKAFAEAKNDKGEPAHPHFKDVEIEMAALVASDRQLGRQPRTLEQLYESAIFANPTVRAKHLAAMEQARKASELAAAKEKATRAKKAASSVSGAPSGGRLPNTGNGSGELREQIMAAVAEHDSAI